VTTTPRRSTSRATAAAASTAYCQVSESAAASGVAEPMIAPAAAGAAPARNATTSFVHQQPLKAGGAEQNEGERRQERDQRRQQRRGQPSGRVADGGDRLRDRPRRYLPEGDRVKELTVGHPVCCGLWSSGDHFADSVRHYSCTSLVYATPGSPVLDLPNCELDHRHIDVCPSTLAAPSELLGALREAPTNTRAKSAGGSALIVSNQK
jgi:hypothetical protein